jgi:hypothetical protein
MNWNNNWLKNEIKKSKSIKIRKYLDYLSQILLGVYAENFSFLFFLKDFKLERELCKLVISFL